MLNIGHITLDSCAISFKPIQETVLLNHYDFHKICILSSLKIMLDIFLSWKTNAQKQTIKIKVKPNKEHCKTNSCLYKNSWLTLVMLFSNTHI